METRTTVAAFDRYLAERGLALEAVIVGGAALNLLGVVTRATNDCDVLHPTIPAPVAEAARQFAAEVRRSGEVLQDDWFNNGSAQLANQLPAGWQDRLEPVFDGAALRLSSLGRLDLLRAKLFALCDRGIDLGDCMALAPTEAELAIALPWLETQDGNPDWPAHARGTVDDLARRLGHAV